SGGAEVTLPPKTTKQKIARRNELKAKSTLLLAILDEHPLKFYGIKDAKTLREAIKTRFGGLDKTNHMFQKLISQLEIHDLDTLSMDYLYNNFKVYAAEFKGQSNSSLNSQIMAFVSSDNTSSSNEAVNTAHDVSAANNEDLEQIDTDDLEEIDLKWQVAMLTMRVKRFIKKTGRNLNLNGKETVSFDKTKIKCYNCHMIGHFAREYRASRSQGNKNRDIKKRVVPVETPAKALVVTDGICYDWSYQAEEGPTDFVLMAFSSSGSSSSDTEDNNQATDRYKAGEGYHAVPPPYIGNFMPPRPDLSFDGLDDSIFKSAISETVTSIHETKTSTSKTSKESMEKPKYVRPSAPIIEDWESDSDDDCEIRPSIE
nr:hypothetical protein [Tanacetum cinerariifolium]